MCECYSYSAIDETEMSIPFWSQNLKLCLKKQQWSTFPTKH